VLQTGDLAAAAAGPPAILVVGACSVVLSSLRDLLRPLEEGGVESTAPCAVPLRPHRAWPAGCFFPASAAAGAAGCCFPAPVAEGLCGGFCGGRCGLCNGRVGVPAPAAASPLLATEAAVALRCSCCCGLGWAPGSLEGALVASAGLRPFAATAVCAGLLSTAQAPGACRARGCPLTPFDMGLRSTGIAVGAGPDASDKTADDACRTATGAGSAGVAVLGCTAVGEGSAGSAILGCAAGAATIPIAGNVPRRRIASSRPPGLNAGTLALATSACPQSDRRAR